MLKVENGNIKQTRGDSATLTVKLEQDGAGVEVGPNDQLTLTVKRSTTSADALVEKTATGTSTIVIDPASLGREYTETDEDIPTDGKFTPTESESGGDGSESNPYTFTAGQKCVLNAYYTSPVKYVYMPADAEAKSYDSWADAAVDMVEWTE